jgi:ABC-type transport system involved in multi-copper enzyme maturation permease subunit
MRLVLVEALTFARRLARRRLVQIVFALDAAALALAVFVSPVASVQAAFAAAQALGALTVLVLASGCVAEDRCAARLALAATHPAPRTAWILGRWLAVGGGAAAVTVLVAVVGAVAGPGFGSAARFAAAAAAAVIDLAALAALAVALSCAAGSTGQVLALLGLLLIGLLPPAVVASALATAWLEPATRVAWTILPAPWALDRLQGWALGAEGSQPLLALALLAQTPLWLAAGARAIAGAELGARGL